MARTTLIILALVILLITALFLWISSQPPASRPNMSIALQHYTNDSTGARLAVFAVTNLSSSSVLLRSHYRIEAPAATRSTNTRSGYLSSGSRVLAAAQGDTLAIPSPTNLNPWRVHFSVDPDVSAIRDIMDAVIVPVRRIGVSTRYRKVTYPIYCDWIDE